jgi:hypothetical protein
MNAKLLENNFLYLPSFISPDEASNLAKEFFDMEKTGQCLYDPMCPNSSVLYNFLPFVRLLVKKNEEIGSILGEEVLPTYVFGRIYKHGAELLRHFDRDACEISLTLNLQQDASWPIWIRKPSGEPVSLNLMPGDAMMYFGITAEHWRDVFQGQSHTQIFLHYVRSYGDCSYAVFDRERRD